MWVRVWVVRSCVWMPVCWCLCVCVWNAVCQEIVVLVNDTEGISAQYEAGEREWPGEGKSLNTGQLSQLATGHSDRTSGFVIGYTHPHSLHTYAGSTHKHTFNVHTQIHT